MPGSISVVAVRQSAEPGLGVQALGRQHVRLGEQQQFTHLPGGRQATYGWPDSLVIGRPAACHPIMPSATLLASQPAPASACAAWSDR